MTMPGFSSLLLSCSAAIGLVAVTSAYGQAPEFEMLVKKGTERYAQVQSYTCLLSRTEWIERTKSYKTQNNILLKRRKPGSIYLKWTEGPGKGTESLYVEGRNNGKMFVHYDNFFRFLTFSIDPASPRALKSNRHTIREADIGFFLDMIEQNMARARADHEGTLSFDGEEMIDSRPTLKYTAELPADRGYYGRRIAINIDRELSLPVKV
jgi:hypothetical protein